MPSDESRRKARPIIIVLAAECLRSVVEYEPERDRKRVLSDLKAMARGGFAHWKPKDRPTEEDLAIVLDHIAVLLKT